MPRSSRSTAAGTTIGSSGASTAADTTSTYSIEGGSQADVNLQEFVDAMYLLPELTWCKWTKKPLEDPIPTERTGSFDAKEALQTIDPGVEDMKFASAEDDATNKILKFVANGGVIGVTQVTTANGVNVALSASRWRVSLTDLYIDHDIDGSQYQQALGIICARWPGGVYERFQHALEYDDISSWAINQLWKDEALKVEALCTAIMVKSGEGMARTWVDGHKICAFVFDRSLMLERLG